MPVFISHRTADDEVAMKIYSRLTYVHKITCYIDNVDKESEKNITNRIVTRIEQSTNLLALVTQNTRGSWWVPFEVGVAREAPRVITTFTNLSSWDLPEYLTEWPVLRGESAIDTFAEHYKLYISPVKRAFLEESATFSTGVTGVGTFHRQLKAALGQ